MKQCSTCKLFKDLLNYHKDKNSKDQRSYSCKECAKQRSRSWHHQNQDKAKKQSKTYRQKNKQKLQEQQKIYTKLHQTTIKLYKQKWWLQNKNKLLEKRKEYGSWHRLNNLDKYAAKESFRRAMKMQRIPAWADKKDILKFYELARKKTQETNIQYHVDHIIPLQGKNVCGLHVENNLQILSAQDNLIKGNRY
jgi:hypothetical protein